MDRSRLENIEKEASIEKADIEKADAKIRALERSDKELNIKDLQPNTTYEKKGYTYQTDNHANPIRVSGELHLKKAERTPQQTEIGRLGKPGDQGGHIIGAQFEGPSDAFNIRPQDASLNHHEYDKLESEWVKALNEGKTVKADIELRYAESTIRPDRYIIHYSIDGDAKTIRLNNQAIQF